MSTDTATRRPTLCLDFDGVLHSYASGWQGAAIINDEPVAGAIRFLFQARDVFDLHIHSSRSHQPGGIAAMVMWLHKHGVPLHAMQLDDVPPPERYDIKRLVRASDWLHAIEDDRAIRFPQAKPAAFLTIDDRARLFDGVFPDPRELLRFKPWHARERIQREQAEDLELMRKRAGEGGVA